MAPLGMATACYIMFVVVSLNFFHLLLDMLSVLLLLLRPYYVFLMTISTSLIPLILLFGPLLPLLSGAVAGQFGFSFPSPLLIFPWFLQHCNQVWVSASFLVMPGHAFCIGGTTELLLQGVPPDVVTTQGRWKSQTFFRVLAPN